jgi:septal ring factor EnvC (AmiA/AmiB activator)
MNDGSPHHGDNWTVEIAHLKATLEGLERLNRQIENERDSFRTLLDAETEERRRIQAQLTALLSDQRKQPEPAKRPWWMFGKAA